MTQISEVSHAPVRAANIVGTKVGNPDGDSLGDIKEIAIDPRTGQVAYAVISFGGFLGMGEKPVSYTHLDVYKRQAPLSTCW